MATLAVFELLTLYVMTSEVNILDKLCLNGSLGR